jgi:hypothetical protein
MVSECRHVIGLATGAYGFLADALELFTAVVAPVFLSLYPLIEIQVPGRPATNSTHVRSPQYDIFTGRLNGI